jgi:hypothetical protein
MSGRIKIDFVDFVAFPSEIERARRISARSLSGAKLVRYANARCRESSSLHTPLVLEPLGGIEVDLAVGGTHLSVRLVMRWSFPSDLHPIALRAFSVAVLCAGIPVNAVSYVVGVIELAHFPAHGLAVQILDDYSEPLSSVL